jgi:hypothetical protein
MASKGSHSREFQYLGEKSPRSFSIIAIRSWSVPSPLVDLLAHMADLTSSTFVFLHLHIKHQKIMRIESSMLQEGLDSLRILQERQLKLHLAASKD